MTTYMYYFSRFLKSHTQKKLWTISYKAHVQVSQLFQGCNILLVTFRVKNIVSFCFKTSLHFALKSCYILRQKLLHFALMLHFASIVTFCGVTNTTSDTSKLSQISRAVRRVKLRITILKYHSWYLCQISLQIMPLPMQIRPFWKIPSLLG